MRGLCAVSPAGVMEAELAAHARVPCACSNGASGHHTLGRHRHGLTDEARALALGPDRGRSVEVVYYLGLKADVERRLPDAIGWYRVALQTYEGTTDETQLAFQRLADWRVSGKSLARLAALPAASDTPRSSVVREGP
jgi:hypothetical protein